MVKSMEWNSARLVACLCLERNYNIIMVMSSNSAHSSLLGWPPARSALSGGPRLLNGALIPISLLGARPAPSGGSSPRRQSVSALDILPLARSLPPVSGSRALLSPIVRLLALARWLWAWVWNWGSRLACKVALLIWPSSGLLLANRRQPLAHCWLDV